MKRSFSFFAIVVLALSLVLPFSAMAQTITLESLTTGDRIGGASIKTFAFAPDGSLVVYVNGPLTWANLDPPITLDSAATGCTVTLPAAVVVQQNAILSFTVRSTGSTFTTPIPVDPDPGVTQFTPGTGTAVFTWNTSGIATGSYLAVFEASAATGGKKSQLPVTIQINPPETISVPTVGGPSAGSVGQSLTFTASGSTSTPAGDQLQYYFDWGTGNSGWLPVGTISASCSWASVGNYLVKAQARSSTNTGVVSVWSSTYGVAISNAPPPATYTLTVNVSPTGGGTVTLNPPGGSYTSGAQVQLTAAGNTNYNFSSWANGASPIYTNPYTVTVTGNTTITANFSSTISTACTNAGDSCAQQLGSAVSLNFAACTTIDKGIYGYVKPTITNCNSAEVTVPAGTISWFLVDGSQVGYSGASLRISIADYNQGNTGGKMMASIYPIDSNGNLVIPSGSKSRTAIIYPSGDNYQYASSTLPASYKYLVKVDEQGAGVPISIYYNR